MNAASLVIFVLILFAISFGISVWTIRLGTAPLRRLLEELVAVQMTNQRTQLDHQIATSLKGTPGNIPPPRS